LLWFSETQRELVYIATQLVSARFGLLDDATRRALEEAASSGRLEELLKRLPQCTSLNELVGQP
jgi:hypothetical protein